MIELVLNKPQWVGQCERYKHRRIIIPASTNGDNVYNVDWKTNILAELLK